MQILRFLLASLLVVPSAQAWSQPAKFARGEAVQQQAFTRKAFLSSLVAGSIATLAMPALADETLSSGVTYKVIKSGPADGPKPEVGELVAIRFKAFAGDLKIDDLFDSPEPYYTRVGSGGLIKGVEQTLPLMKLGDRWEMTIPVGERQQKYRSSPVATFCKLLTLMSCF
jgi:FKBP-type peptidyl-prolyl cis-trans isomerase